ncbi:hypothetical protein [Methylobacterium sp. E-066]|nr:hypothetical protein [Methylobacterium sp. E-066]MCJ2138432.1 hypothetical protein [Methylobacterium sp. E-066]
MERTGTQLRKNTRTRILVSLTSEPSIAAQISSAPEFQAQIGDARPA